MKSGVENSVAAAADARRGDGAPGIGLANLERRLHLLYPRTHALEIDRGTGQFSARLRVPLRARHDLPDALHDHDSVPGRR